MTARALQFIESSHWMGSDLESQRLATGLNILKKSYMRRI